MIASQHENCTTKSCETLIEEVKRRFVAMWGSLPSNLDTKVGLHHACTGKTGYQLVFGLFKK
jgi:hypothetical protein